MIRASDIRLEKGDSLALIVKARPLYHKLENLDYITGDERIATVTEHTLSAVDDGETTVCASADYNGAHYSAETNVTVSDLGYDIASNRTATEIVLARYTDEIKVGEEYALQAYIMSAISEEHPYPYGYQDDNIVLYASSNPDVCRIKNGVLLGVAPGDAVITVSDLSGNCAKTLAVHVAAVETTEYADDDTLVVNADAYDWSTAETTTLAIQSILASASGAGKKRVVFPAQIYYVSPVYGSIQIPTMMVVDFSGSTIQIEPSAMTETGYAMICFADTVDSSIVNATILGERDLIDGTGAESCMSVKITGVAKNSGLSHCTISKSPGFNLGINNSGRKVSGVSLGGITAGGLDDSGAEIEEEYAYRSGYVDISNVGNAEGKIWLGNVQGYGGYLYMSARVFDTYFYDADKVFISHAKRCIQYYAIDKPADAVYARIVYWWGSAPTSSDPDYHAIAHFHSYDKPIKCYVKDCVLEDNYSLAINPNGGEDTLIERCTFRRNGYRDPASHIDWEDGRQHNKGHIVRYCTFESGGTAIMSVNSDGLVVHNNVFKSAPLSLGSETQNARVWLNQFFETSVDIYPKTDEVFSQNYGYDGSSYKLSSVDNVGFDVRAKDNTFI